MPITEVSLSKKEKLAEEARKFIARVYGWMAVALIVSGLSAFFTAVSPVVFNLVFGNRFGIYVLFAIEILLVIILSAAIRKMPAFLAGLMFVLYSIVNGMTLSVIFLVFRIDSIALVFFISAGMFIAMSIYGTKTSQNLNSAGRYFMMAIFGLVIASIVNLLFKSSVLDWIITLVTLVVFIGLTAYDTQKIVRASELADGSDTFKKAAIFGALELYLDFINIFLSLLKLFGKER